MFEYPPRKDIVAQMYGDEMAEKYLLDGKFESEITFQEFSQLLNLQ